MFQYFGYSPKILNTKVLEKVTYMNSEDSEQTAPEEAICLPFHLVF